MVKLGKVDFKEEIYYTKEHMWVKVEADGKVRVGIDEIFARASAGKKAYITGIYKVTLPAEGENVEQGKKMGVLMSKKVVEDLIAPVSGSIVEVNWDTTKPPGVRLIQTDPYGKYWMLLIKPSNLDAEVKNLLKGEPALAWFKEQYEEKEQFF